MVRIGLGAHRRRGIAVRPALVQSPLWAAIATVVDVLLRVVGLGAYHGYIYDESYYVVAAQNLLGIAHGRHNGALGAFHRAGLVPFTDPNLASAPPLGKELIAAAIWLFGNHAWAWRLPGALAEITLPFAVYGLARRLFPRVPAVAAVAFVASVFDGMSIALARVAILDSTTVPLLLWGLYLVAVAADALRQGQPPRRLTLLGMGAFLGAALADKWTGGQALLLAGFWLLAAWWQGRRRPLRFGRRRRLWIGPALAVTLWPLAIYIATYAWARGPQGFGADWVPTGSFLRGWWVVQKTMLHGMWGLTFHHPWLAPAWSWFLLARPTYVLSVLQNGWHSNIYVLANPWLIWLGAVSLVAGGLALVRHRLPAGLQDPFPWLILWAWVAVFYGTWFLSPRVKFFYYFFPVLPALAIAAGTWPALAATFWPGRRRLAQWLPTALFLATTLYLLPLWVGLPLPDGFYHGGLWPPSWNALPTPSTSITPSPPS